MNYTVFRDRFHDYGVFSIYDIRKSFPVFDSRRLVEWQIKGYIRKIINRWYIFTDIKVDDHMKLWVANRIYQPSYVSMESALSHHGLIPEAVYTITSLTSNKTISFDTSEGSYSYRHIKPALFFGYHTIQWQKFPLRMADPEKVLLDYLYLNPGIKNSMDIESIRLNTKQIQEQFNLQRFKDYLILFKNKALSKRANVFLKFCELC